MNFWRMKTKQKPTAKTRAAGFCSPPHLMALLVLLLLTAVSFTTFDSGKALAQAGSNENAVHAPVATESIATEVTDTTSAKRVLSEEKYQKSDAYDLNSAKAYPPGMDDEDRARIEKFKRLVPDRWRAWLPDARRQAHHHTPVLSYKYWSNEPKRFAPTLLFCLFTGLVGVAFFSRQVTVAQECCKTQFWRCFFKASLSGITLLISVIVLDRLGITGALATTLLAVLELVVVAGLSVGVSLIGERVLEKTGLARLEYFKSHPRMTTFTKVFIGSLIIALIVQIPGLGRLPRIGIRIATLIAVLGAGGLLNTKFGTQSGTPD